MLYVKNFINLIKLYFQKAASISELAFKVLASNSLDGISNLYCSTCDQYELEIDYSIGCVLILHYIKYNILLQNLRSHKMKGVRNV
jgi:hypothetical protein